MFSQVQSQIALIPLCVLTLIPFGQVIALFNLTQTPVLQRARANNRNIIVGNSGVTTTGIQTASPTNVNTR